MNAVGSADWRVNLVALSVFAAAGGAIALLVGEGPFSVGSAPFDPRQIVNVFRNRGVRLASYGYFGHMWELYAMWTWIPVMIRASFAARGSPHGLAEAGSFLVIGAGAVGCVAAGIAADRVGRTAVASAAMVVSGACCLGSSLTEGSARILLRIVVDVVSAPSSGAPPNMELRAKGSWPQTDDEISASVESVLSEVQPPGGSERPLA